MKSLKVIFTVLFVTYHCMIAEGGGLKQIRKALEKNKYEKAEKVICKALAKDSINPGTKFFLSVMLIKESYRHYSADSSWHWINRAIADLDKADDVDLKNLEKIDLKPKDLTSLRSHIAEIAYDSALSKMSLQSFNHYLTTYTSTKKYERATYMRDSLAYHSTKAINTWQAYQNYFISYPNSSFVPDARQRYQSLIFKDYTKDDDLSSYIKFLEEHPSTPFRRLTEEIIFVRGVRDHEWSSYYQFLQKYPRTHLRKRIGDILYYKSKANQRENLEEVFNLHPKSDSLLAQYELERRVLFPIYEGAKYGFMSAGEEMIITPNYSEIGADFLCGDITNEWLHADEKVFNRRGVQLLDKVQDFKELKEGVIMVTTDANRLYHKSGFRINDLPLTDAVGLTQGIIAIKPTSSWGLITILGHQLLPPEYQSITERGDFIILEEEDSFRISTPGSLTASEKPYLVSHKFDDYEVIGDTLLQGFQGNRECLLDRNLNYLIPLDTHAIYISNSSWYVKDGSGYQLYDKTDTALISQKFASLNTNEGWISLKQPEGWMLISRRSAPAVAIRAIDSVKLISEHAAFYKKGDTLSIIFSTGTQLPLKEKDKIRLLKSSLASYILLQSAKETRILDKHGQQLFEGRYEDVAVLGDSTFRYKKNSKVGVLDSRGKVIVAPKYDLADENHGLIFLLKGTTIGCYDIQRDLLIPAAYQTRILRFDNKTYQVQSKGKIGLVDTTSELTIPMVYQELLLWNDTSLWAKENNNWKLVNFKNEVILDNVANINIWLISKSEIFAIVRKEGGRGLFSNKNGTILPAQYNDILNVGSQDSPIFFAEQHLKAASFYVATYFDRYGRSIRSQAFRPEEYERIYCEQ